MSTPINTEHDEHLMDGHLMGATGDRYLDQYFGAWAIEDMFANGLIAKASTIRLAEHRHDFIKSIVATAAVDPAAGPDDVQNQPQGPFRGVITQDAVAIIPVRGTLMKFTSSLSSSTGTVELRRQVRNAAADDRVRAVLLKVDSPGGTVAGTAELADDIKAAAKKKPLWAYADDLMASAAYWISSSAARIGANRTAMVGSLGTVAVLYDWSVAFKQAGVKPLVFSTGKFKGAAALGAKITDEQKAYFQALIDETNTHFKAAVAEGPRKVDVASLFDGRVHVAGTASNLGLVNDVTSFDDFYGKLVSSLGPARPRTVGAAAETVITATTEELLPSAGDDAPKSEPSAAKADDVEPVVEEANSSTPAVAGEGVEMSTTATTGATPGAAGGAQPASVTQTAVPATPQSTVTTGTTATAATIQQLKAACPGAASDFLMAQLEAGATIEAAKDAYVTFLLAERNKPAATAGPTSNTTTQKRPGIRAVGGRAAEQGGAAGDGGAEFKALVMEKRKSGMSAADAVEAAAIERPDLHERMLGAA